MKEHLTQRKQEFIQKTSSGTSKSSTKKHLRRGHVNVQPDQLLQINTPILEQRRRQSKKVMSFRVDQVICGCVSTSHDTDFNTPIGLRNSRHSNYESRKLGNLGLGSK